MRYFILLLFILCAYGCSNKNNNQIQKSDYIIDTTLQFEYIDIPFNEYQPKCKSKVNIEEKDAFNIACEIINKMHNHEIILHLPLRMRLINDSVWIIRNMNVSKNPNEILFGGAIYLEIRKSDGCILKSIIEE